MLMNNVSSNPSLLSVHLLKEGWIQGTTVNQDLQAEAHLAPVAPLASLSQPAPPRAEPGEAAAAEGRQTGRKRLQHPSAQAQT